MVICSYFIKGICRFGQDCKNEHAYNSGASSSVLSNKPEVDLATLIKSAAGDMLKAEQGHQWPLTCFGPYQAKPCFPGFEDTCFEEIRLGYYEAQKKGSLEQYKSELASILQEAQMKIKALQNPSAEASNILREIYFSNSQSNQNSIFNNANSQNAFSNNPQSNSIFGNTPNTQNNSLFGGISSTNPSSNFSFTIPETKNVFSNPQPVSSTSFKQNSIFGSTPTNNFTSTSQSIFGGAQPSQNPVFANTNQVPNQSQNLFGNVANNSPFTQQNTGSTMFVNNANNSLFGNTQATNSPFSNTQTATNSLFSNTPTVSNTAFSNTQNTNPPFTNPQSTNSPFGNTQSNNPSFVNTPSTNTPFGNTQSNATFSVQNTNSPFSATSSSSIFGTGQNTVNTPFGNVPPNNSPFTNTTSNSPFTTTTNTSNTPFVNQTTFANAFQMDKPNDNPFLNASKIIPNDPFKNPQNSLFNSAQTHSTNIFGKTTIKKDDPTVYSKLNELSTNDIAQYEKQCFDFGKIPTRAPPLEMC